MTSTSRQNRTLLVDGAEIRWRNFSGEKRMYNDEGKRNFVLFLPKDIADERAAEGWPIKVLPAREEGEEEKYFVRVNVKLGGKNPPTVVLITHKGRNQLDDDLVGTLDHVWLRNVDLVVRKYDYDYNGKTGTNVYLNAIYATLEEDPNEILLEERYADVPEALDALDVPGVDEDEEEAPF